jgi:hypothetical protein
MEFFDQINRLQAITPNAGGLSSFEKGQLQVYKDVFDKLTRKDYDIETKV